MSKAIRKPAAYYPAYVIGGIMPGAEFGAEYRMPLPYKTIAWVAAVFVNEALRRQRIGTRLLAEFLDTAMARGAEACFVEPVAEDRSMQYDDVYRFYQLSGFDSLPEELQAVADPNMLMFKALPPPAGKAPKVRYGKIRAVYEP